MTLGSTMTQHAYGEPAYWDSRYRQDPGPFDWYQKYKTLAPLLDLYIRRSHRVLLVGCGNSTLGEGMVGDGYQDVVNIDISSVVVEAMQQKYQGRPEMKCIQLSIYNDSNKSARLLYFVFFNCVVDIKMDVRDMNGFESSSFDAVIDKGTLDSLMCGHDAQPNTKKMLEEIGRILKDKGVYILITYGDPSYRLRLLKDLRLWTINMHVIDRMEKTPEQRSWELTAPLPLNEDGSSVSALLGGNPEVHYIYVCTKDDSLRKHQ